MVEGLAAGVRCLASLVVFVLLAVTSALAVALASAAVGGPDKGICIPALLAAFFVTDLVMGRLYAAASGAALSALNGSAGPNDTAGLSGPAVDQQGRAAQPLPDRDALPVAEEAAEGWLLLLALLLPAAVPAGVSMHAIAVGPGCCCMHAMEWDGEASGEVRLSGTDTDGMVSTDRSMLALAAGVGPAVAVCMIAAGLATRADTGESPSVHEKGVTAGAGIGENPSMAEKRVTPD